VYRKKRQDILSSSEPWRQKTDLDNAYIREKKNYSQLHKNIDYVFVKLGVKYEKTGVHMERIFSQYNR